MTAENGMVVRRACLPVFSVCLVYIHLCPFDVLHIEVNLSLSKANIFFQKEQRRVHDGGGGGAGGCVSGGAGHY